MSIQKFGDAETNGTHDYYDDGQMEFWIRYIYVYIEFHDINIHNNTVIAKQLECWNHRSKRLMTGQFRVELMVWSNDPFYYYKTFNFE